MAVARDCIASAIDVKEAPRTLSVDVMGQMISAIAKMCLAIDRISQGTQVFD